MINKLTTLSLKQINDYETFRLLICCLTALNITQPIYKNKDLLIKARNSSLSESYFINLHTLVSVYKLSNTKSVQLIANIICEQVETVHFQCQKSKNKKQGLLDRVLTTQYLKRFNYIYNSTARQDRNNSKIFTKKNNSLAMQLLFFINGI